ncbi:MAG: HD domain-containing protein [Firmicutes bacterium]|nr:HD domain-containing protein [Bacillota bacterium]
MVSKKVMDFVATQVLSVYDAKIKYKRAHIDFVLRRSLQFAAQCNGVNVDMVYVIAAYHDIGEIDNRETHHIVGANMLRANEWLPTFFTPDQIETMAAAVEDHRASSKSAPRTIYGRIVRCADTVTSIDDFLQLSYGFRLHYGCDMSIEKTIDDAYDHLVKKFGRNGYTWIKPVYFDDPEYTIFREDALRLSNDKAAFAKRFRLVNGL